MAKGLQYSEVDKKKTVSAGKIKPSSSFNREKMQKKENYQNKN